MNADKKENKVMASGHRRVANPLLIMKGAMDLTEIILEDPILDTLVCGAALEPDGFDRVLMDCIMQADIKLILSLPFKHRMLNSRLKQYIEYCRDTTDIFLIPEVKAGSSQAYYYHKRNQMGVDIAGYFGIFWDGRTSGGTFHAQKYARKTYPNLVIRNLFNDALEAAKV